VSHSASKHGENQAKIVEIRQIPPQTKTMSSTRSSLFAMALTVRLSGTSHRSAAVLDAAEVGRYQVFGAET
jgi:hypothetical protein